ncbi:MAG: hypothetical protein ABIY35_00700 [Chitinophagaceae bacterium]
MKFTLAYYLILLYSTVILNPVIPIVSDILSHTFAEAYHISVVHAKYGANHLQQELTNTTNENGQHKKNLDEQSQTGTHLPVLMKNIIESNTIQSQKFTTLPILFCQSVYLKKVSPPPKNV